MPDETGFETATHLHIDPTVWMDSGACGVACRVSAIFARDLLPLKWLHYAGSTRIVACRVPRSRRVSEVRPLRVALFGSGPSGMYAAGHLLETTAPGA